VDPPSLSSCKGLIKGLTIARKEEIAKAARMIYEELLESSAKQLQLPITDKNVYWHTNNRIKAYFRNVT